MAHRAIFSEGVISEILWCRMKFRFWICVLLAFALAGQSAVAADKTVHVKGYTRKDGTYVKPYDRRAPGSGSSRTKSGGSDKDDDEEPIYIAPLKKKPAPSKPSKNDDSSELSRRQK